MSVLHEAPIQKLPPTQLGVGMTWVHVKEKHLAFLRGANRRDSMGALSIPAAQGPAGCSSVTDRHHPGQVTIARLWRGVGGRS